MDVGLDVTFELLKRIISWLPWVPNLLLAEWFIKKWGKAGFDVH